MTIIKEKYKLYPLWLELSLWLLRNLSSVCLWPHGTMRVREQLAIRFYGLGVQVVSGVELLSNDGWPHQLPYCLKLAWKFSFPSPFNGKHPKGSWGLASVSKLNHAFWLQIWTTQLASLWPPVLLRAVWYVDWLALFHLPWLFFGTFTCNIVPEQVIGWWPASDSRWSRDNYIALFKYYKHPYMTDFFSHYFHMIIGLSLRWNGVCWV